MVFSWEPALWTLNSQVRVMVWWSKKPHCNFCQKQRLLSIEMKSKLCSACWVWLNERLKECECKKEWEWDSEREWLQILTFELTHENKSCSEHSNIHDIPDSQLLSDIRTFFMPAGAKSGFRTSIWCIKWSRKDFSLTSTWSSKSRWMYLGGG